MILYYKDTGMIFRKCIPDQSLESYLYHYNENEKKNIGVIYGQDDINIRNKIFDNGLIRSMTDIEIDEIFKYGKILLESERLENQLLNKLKPTLEEIRKAENTIEILTLIQEVM